MTCVEWNYSEECQQDPGLDLWFHLHYTTGRQAYSIAAFPSGCNQAQAAVRAEPPPGSAPRDLSDCQEQAEV